MRPGLLFSQEHKVVPSEADSLLGEREKAGTAAHQSSLS